MVKWIIISAFEAEVLGSSPSRSVDVGSIPARPVALQVQVLPGA